MKPCLQSLKQRFALRKACLKTLFPRHGAEQPLQPEEFIVILQSLIGQRGPGACLIGTHRLDRIGEFSPCMGMAAGPADSLYFIVPGIAIRQEEATESFQETTGILSGAAWLILVQGDLPALLMSTDIVPHIGALTGFPSRFTQYLQLRFIGSDDRTL